jgi:phosphatidylglycerophosphate synthase
LRLMALAERSGGDVRLGLARTADLLTAGRAVLAVLLAWLVGGGHLEAAALVLAAAWASDALDGRLAQVAGGGTRLGEWDLPADTLVGVGVLVGLAIGGYLPIALVLAAVVVLGGAFALLRNPFPAMALQALAWGAILWRFWADRVVAGWVPVAVAGVIGLAERDRFLRVVLPAFFRGAASTARLRRGRSYRMPDPD